MEVRIGLSGALTLVFVILKLLGYTDWSWWWVFSPTLIPIGLYLLAFVVIWAIGLVFDERC